MWVSVSELSDATGIHSESIYRSVRNNSIPHVRVGKRIFFHQDTVKEYFGNLIWFNRIIWKKNLPKERGALIGEGETS